MPYMNPNKCKIPMFYNPSRISGNIVASLLNHNWSYHVYILPGRDVIEVSWLDGRYRKTLIQGNLDEPRAIAVHPKKG